MPPIAIALIAILAAHYFFAIATIFALLREKGVTKAIIPWNLVILLLPLAGPLAYWLYRLFKKKPSDLRQRDKSGPAQDVSMDDAPPSAAASPLDEMQSNEKNTEQNQ